MEMLAVLIVVGLILLGLFLEAYLLHLLLKIFRAKSPDYKNSLIVIIISWLLIVVATYVLSVVIPDMTMLLYGNLILSLVMLVVFHFLLKKLFQTGFVKNLFIYILHVVLVVIAGFLFIIPIRMYLIEPFYALGAAMEPAIEDNDYILGLKFAKDYNRGDIVVFKYPKDENQIFLKRLIGLPGDRIMFKEEGVILYNQDYPNGVNLNETDYLSSEVETNTLNGTDFKLAEDEYFVLGDNRENSLDSRMFGPVKESLIIAKYWISLPYFNKQINE